LTAGEASRPDDSALTFFLKARKVVTDRVGGRFVVQIAASRFV
jgi:hypothetical protein